VICGLHQNTYPFYEITKASATQSASIFARHILLIFIPNRVPSLFCHSQKPKSGYMFFFAAKREEVSILPQTTTTG
jgi:hypothetical protein